MIELATRVALGETLARLGWRARSDRAAVAGRGQGAGLLDDEAARRRSDARPGHAVDRRGDRSAHRRRAWRWPRRLSPPRSGRRCRTTERPRWPCYRSPIATRTHWASSPEPLAICWLPVLRHARHCRALRALGHDVEEVARVGDESGSSRSVLDAISSGNVLLVVNTPSPESRPMRDAGAIRMAATAEGILCLTSIDTALAAAAALDPVASGLLDDVRPLDEWLGATSIHA